MDIKKLINTISFLEGLPGVVLIASGKITEFPVHNKAYIQALNVGGCRISRVSP